MPNLTDYLNKLNPEQRRAVDQIQGPVLVVAGPGTGKTQMLALRIANIIKTTDTRASSILCLTFTETGVVAMRKRLQEIIGNDAFYVRIETFHSFCNEIIQSFPEKFAFARELIQLEDLTRIKLMHEILDELPSDRKLTLRPFHNPYENQGKILSAIQTLKKEGVTAGDFVEIAQQELQTIESNPTMNKKTGKPTTAWNNQLKNAQRNAELAEIYSLYDSKVQARGYYDYEDMILFVIDKFETDDELLAFYQEKFLYILVDEYQDTNGAQNKVIKMLGSFDQSPNIFAVGDDDQAIYRFQGANVDNLLFFTEQFKDVVTIPVTTNYRSSQLILDLADSLINHNQNRLVNLIPGLEKKLHAGTDTPNHKARIYEFSDNDAENRFLIEQIRRLHADGVPYDQIAVLFRRNNEAEDIAEALVKAGVPITLAAGRNALDERIVDKLITLLKVVEYTDANRDLLLFEVLFYDFLKLDRLDIFKITRYAHDQKLSLFAIINDDEQLTAAKVGDKEKLKTFADKIISWKAADANLSLIQLIELVSVESGFLPYVFGGEVNIEDINAVNSFYQYVKSLNRQDKHIKLPLLIEDIELLRENKLAIPERELDTSIPGVNLMTAHKSKGLEFQHVFITKMHDGSWGGGRKPSGIKLPDSVFRLSEQVVESNADQEIEDERRLLFVALTRAKQQLYITYAKVYPSGNSTKEVGPNQFLTNLGTEFVEQVDTATFTALDLDALKTQLSPIPTITYTEQESEYLHSILENFRLSASALNCYIRCPLQFKFDYLLRVPHAPQRHMALGTAIHFAFEHFYRQLQGGKMEELSYVLYLFEEQLKRELLGESDYALTLTEGRKILSDYYNNYYPSFIAPVEIEYGFYGRNLVIESEKTDPIRLSGKLDKIEWVDQEHYTVKVIDYKVTSPKSANDIRGETKKDDASIFRQLVFYKLLGDIDQQFRPSSMLPKYKIEQAEIDFIKPNQSSKYKRENFTITDQDVAELTAQITDVMIRIRNLEFNGTEAYPLCEECEYCTRIKN